MPCVVTPGDRPVSNAGITMILAGLTGNLLLAGTLSDVVSTRRPSWSLVLFLLTIGALLVYGIFWPPLRAALAGLEPGSYVAFVFGKRAAWLIRWGVAPLSLMAWFSVVVGSARRVLELIFRMSGVDDGAFLLDPVTVICILAALTSVGVRGDLRSFAQSSIWLCKVSVAALVGLLLLYWNDVPPVKRFAPYLLPLDGAAAAGLALQFFGVPLLLLGYLLVRGDGRPRAVSRPWHRIAWLGIAAAPAIAVWAWIWIDIGSRATVPKTFGFYSSLRGPEAVMAGKLLIVSLGLLVPLRLGPRLLLGLWDIPRDSLRAALVVASLFAGAILFQEPLSAAPLPLDLLLGVAGTLSGMAAATFGRYAWARWRSQAEEAVVIEESSGATLRAVFTIAGVLFAIAVASSPLQLGTVFEAALRLDFTPCGWYSVNLLLGLQNLPRTLLYAPDLPYSAASLWSWTLCFASGAIITALKRRHR